MEHEHSVGSQRNQQMEEELVRLRKENALLREQFRNFYTNQPTVDGPPELQEMFRMAQRTVQHYFLELTADPAKARIAVNDERYVLVRASSLSLQFFNKIKDLYADRGEEAAFRIGRNFLFDVAHVLGASDAKNFHKRMKLTDPVSKLSAGPVHFAYTGWASVKILPDSRPSSDENFFLHYDHPNSFEADSWLKEGIKPPFPVCIMNSGYSSGWCSESFDQPLTAVEITCKARGDDQCRFIMAPPDRIQEYLPEDWKKEEDGTNDIPLFFQRKEAEEKLRNALEEKNTLLKELHHRVKNNLQIVSSLISMQAHFLKDPKNMEFLQSLQERIKAIALVHERLHQAEDVEFVDLREYLQGLVNAVFKSLAGPGIKLELDIEPKLGKLHIDRAISAGLIVNEVVSNACKYAFPEKKGAITIRARRQDDLISLEIADDGKGFDPGGTKGNSLGLELVEILGEQLDAKVQRNTKDGTSYFISFQA